MMRHATASFLAAVLVSLSSMHAPLQASQGLSIEPAAACTALRDFRLDAGAYRPADGGRYQCRSRRLRLPQGAPLRNEIRYVAYGGAERVERLELQLDLFGRREMQATLQRMLQYAESLANTLLDRALGQEITNTLLAAGSGEWDLDGGRVRLLRNTATGSQGFRYTLILD